MHEWLITRGDVAGCAFEIRMQIYVPENCVIVHEGECHRVAQFGEKGRQICLQHVLHFHPKRDILSWLTVIEPEIRIAQERIKWLTSL